MPDRPYLVSISHSGHIPVALLPLKFQEHKQAILQLLAHHPEIPLLKEVTDLLFQDYHPFQRPGFLVGCFNIRPDYNCLIPSDPSHCLLPAPFFDCFNFHALYAAFNFYVAPYESHKPLLATFGEGNTKDARFLFKFLDRMAQQLEIKNYTSLLSYYEASPATWGSYMPALPALWGAQPLSDQDKLVLKNFCKGLLRTIKEDENKRNWTFYSWWKRP
jgi:hypothetical protein